MPCKEELKNKTRFEIGMISKNLDRGYNPYGLTRFELAQIERKMKTMSEHRHMTEELIKDYQEGFMQLSEAENRDFHDNCDQNTCKECACIDMRTNGKLRAYELSRR